MSDFLNDAEKYADSHEQQVDEALEKAAKEAEQRTGDRYDPQIEQGVKAAEEHIGDDKR